MAAPSVSANIFNGTLQGIINFTNTQVKVLVDSGYDIQYLVLYWKFTDIKDWYQLKSMIPANSGGIYDGDRKIKGLQALDCWVTNLTLQCKIIDLNRFKTETLAYAIEESWLDFEDTRYGKGELSNPKDF